jgi:hypothetical protein
MRARRAGLALAGLAAAALTMGPGALSSAAATATMWTVRPGGTITAKAGTTKVMDTITDSLLNCDHSRMSGTLKGGTGLPGTGIGSVTAAAYDCAILIEPPFRLTPHGLPWHLNLASYDAGTGTSRGTISRLELTLTGPSCSAMINGTGGSAADGVVAISYASKTGKLKLSPAGGNLHWYHVSGCAGLVGDGDPATLSAAYTLSPQQRIISP